MKKKVVRFEDVDNEDCYKVYGRADFGTDELDELIGELYYSVGNVCWMLRSGDLWYFTEDELSQITQFMKKLRK